MASVVWRRRPTLVWSSHFFVKTGRAFVTSTAKHSSVEDYMQQKDSHFFKKETIFGVLWVLIAHTLHIAVKKGEKMYLIYCAAV